MKRVTPEEYLLMRAESALRHASTSEFSARVTPAQAVALLDELERLRRDQRALRALRGVTSSLRSGSSSGIGAPPDFGRSGA